MPNIETYLAKIREAVYGEEVRGSIHDAIQAINEEVDDSEQVALKRSIASTYSSSSTYRVGDYVFYPESATDGILYKCITNIPVGEAWNSSHWVSVELGDEVKYTRNNLKHSVETFDYMYNLSLIKDGVSESINGVTISCHDGIYTLNGTSTAAIVYRIYYNVNNLPEYFKTGKDYKVYIKSSKSSGVNLRVNQYKNGSQTSSVDTNSYFVLHINSDTQGMQIAIYIPSGIALSNDTFEVNAYDEDAVLTTDIVENIDQVTNNLKHSSEAFDYMYNISLKKEGAQDLVNGVTFSFNDGIFTLNGTSTSSTVYNIYYDTTNLPEYFKTGKDYKVYIKSSKSSGVNLRVNQYKNGSQTSSVDTNSYFVLHVNSDTQGMQIAIYIPSGTTLSNDTFEVKIYNKDAVIVTEIDSNFRHSVEAFDYMYNLSLKKNDTQERISNVTISCHDGIYTLNGTTSASAVYRIYYDTTNLPEYFKTGKDYKVYIKSSKSSGVNLRVNQYKNGSQTSSVDTNSYFVLHINSDTQGMMIAIYIPSGIVLSNDTFEVKIYDEDAICVNEIKSNLEHSVEEFDYMYNLALKKDETQEQINGVTISCHDGIYTLNGTSTATVIYRIYYNIDKLPEYFMAGKDYKVYINTSKNTKLNLRVNQYKNGSQTSSVDTNSYFVLHVNSDTQGMQIAIYVASGITLSNDTIEVKIYDAEAAICKEIESNVNDIISIVYPQNWFDEENAFDGYYQYSGFVEDSSFVSTKTYVPCNAGKYVVASHEWLTSGAGRRSSSGLIRSYIYYDENRQYITQTSGTNIVPDGAYYLRFSVNKSLTTGENTRFMLEVKDENTFGEYSPYFEPYAVVKDLKSLETQITSAYEKRAEIQKWLGDAFGLFIHWGVYSALEGIYNGVNVDGEQVSYDNGSDWVYGAEWILWTVKIPKSIYKQYGSQFTSTGYNADDIARLAYEAGMKYVVITSKHHEGFALYPSQYSEWTIDTTPARNTVLDELKAACDKYGLKFCLYFSQFRDWTAIGGFNQDFISGSDPYTIAQHKNYIEQTVKMLEELVQRYDPYVIWWDGDKVSSLYTDPVYDWLTIKHPNIITNDRLGYGKYQGDYATGEGAYYSGTRLIAENCYTLNGTWGYSSSKDTAQLTTTVENLLKARVLESVTRGQNALINVGPKKDGSIPQLQINLLTSLATFAKKYGLFKNRKRVNVNSQPLWGRMHSVGNILRCFVYEGSTIRVDGIDTFFIKSVRVYGAQDEYSSSNYSITSDDTITINNLVYEEPYKLAIVDIEFSTDIVSKDINYVAANDKINVLAFNIFGVMTLRQNGNSRINYLQWANNNYYLTTHFIYTGSSGSYHITNENLGSESGANYSLKSEITDLSSGNVTELTMTNNTESSEIVQLVNGNEYRIKLTKTGGWFNLRSVWFTS